MTTSQPEAKVTWTQLPDRPLVHVKPTQIIADIGERARKKYGDLEELVQSIRDKGVIQPLAVQATEEEGVYKLLAGGRRYSAAVLAHLTPLPAIVFPVDLDPIEAEEIQLFENVHRMDFEFFEKDKLVKRIHELKVKQHGIALGGTEDKTGHSMSDTGALLGKERSSVSKSISRAEAVEKHPELLKAKNASEADRILKRIERRETAARAAQAYEEEVTHDTDEGTMKRSLAQGYIKGDFFEQVGSIPDKSANLIEIDPPYGIELEEIKRADEDILEGYTETEDYPAFITKVIQESFRVLAPGGWMICWHAYQWQQATFEAMTTSGLNVNPIPAFWVKPNGQTNHPEKRLASTVEPFLYGTKSDGHIIQQGRNNSFIFKPVAPVNKSHPTERPVELMEEIIRTFTLPNNFVFVPFLGSGNTLLAAANVGMANIFGFDLDSENIYRNAFVEKVQDGRFGHYKSHPLGEAKAGE